ncbi:MAG: Rieske 2Fe-2S domain-containing protein [Myxococcota bacterium]|nr:Rieske 2Fe-2S domain-containing protein [Myxococcota bacterium]
MGLLRILVFGRPNGIRARLLGRATGSPERLAPMQERGSAAAEMVVGERSLSLGLEAPKDVTPPEGYEVVLHKDALEAGQVIEIIIAGRAIAVANVDGTFFALSNACPHAQGPLGEGTLAGPVVSCPYHGWEFDVRTGGCLTDPSATVETYAVEVVEHAVCVAI